MVRSIHPGLILATILGGLLIGYHRACGAQTRMEPVPIRSPVRARAAGVTGLRFDTPTGYVSLMKGLRVLLGVLAP